MLRIIFLVFGAILCFNTSYAEEEHLFGNWTTAFINGKFGKDSNWTYMGEAGIRASQYPSSFHRDKDSYDIGSVPIRAGIGYQIDKNNSVMGGYLFQYSTMPYAKTTIYENRVWQQFMNVLDFHENGKLANRTRFEQRTLTTSGEVALRLRHQLKYNYKFDKDWGFTIGDELFINCNTVNWGPVEGIDQNRFFVGPTYQVTENFRTEFGYLNQFVNKDTATDLMSHIFAVNLYYDVPD